jgi:hypothetical protein
MRECIYSIENEYLGVGLPCKPCTELLPPLFCRVLHSPDTWVHWHHIQIFLSSCLQFLSGSRICITLMRIRIPLYTLMRNRIRLFTSIRIRIQIKVMQICDHWSTNPQQLHFEPPRIHCPSWLNFEPLKLLNFDLVQIGIQIFTLKMLIPIRIFFRDADTDPQPCFLLPPSPPRIRRCLHCS